MTAIPLKSLAVGTFWTVDSDGNVQLLNGEQIYVYQRGTLSQVQVYSDQALTQPLAQPVSTGGDGTSGAVPGYIAAEQPIDLADAQTGIRYQAEPLAVNDLIGTDGKIGGPTSVGLSTQSGFVSYDTSGAAVDLSGHGGTTPATGTTTGDKIAIYAGTYGLGFQAARLVAYVDTATGAGFAVRKTSASGNKSSGSDVVVLGNDGGVTGTYGVNARATLTYSTSITPSFPAGPWQTITVTNSTAFTINAPTSPPAGTQTAELTIEVYNNSGGSMGTITWNAVFIFAGVTWANPANTKHRFARFEWNGNNWVCTSFSMADY